MLPFQKIKRTILIKKEEDSKIENTITPEELMQYGIVNIDKPRGPTSHQVSDFVQRILNIEKAGHSGTLDPHVTGVLPIALGRATRIVQFLLKSGKEYVCLMHIHKKVDKKKIKKVFSDFTGKIKQKPPIRSAVKRVERTRNIYYLEILEINEQDVLFKVGCQAGTYIRKLCHDMGRVLGGAHMQELRRTKVADIDEGTLVTLQDLADAVHFYKNEKNDKFLRYCIKPIEEAITNLPKIWVFDTTVKSLTHGSDLKVPGISKLESDINPDDLVAVLTLNDQLIAVGGAKMTSQEIMEQEKGIAVDINKVFIKEIN